MKNENIKKEREGVKGEEVHERRGEEDKSKERVGVAERENEEIEE